MLKNKKDFYWKSCVFFVRPRTFRTTLVFRQFWKSSPKELVRYFGRVKIEYNYTSYQSYNQSICGQLCLKFLQTVDDQFKA